MLVAAEVPLPFASLNAPAAIDIWLPVLLVAAVATKVAVVGVAVRGRCPGKCQAGRGPERRSRLPAVGEPPNASSKLTDTVTVSPASTTLSLTLIVAVGPTLSTSTEALDAVKLVPVLPARSMNSAAAPRARFMVPSPV